MSVAEPISSDHAPLTSQADAKQSVAPSIPEHQLISRIASGAYGEVWLGRNAVGTLRAIKVVRRDQNASPEFEREFKGMQRFEPVSRTHPGLVDILTLGLLPEGFYYVMELADELASVATPRVASSGPIASGSPAFRSYTPRTLRVELKQRGPLRAEDTISIGLKLSAALAHLHGHGLVHRDVKPSNIVFIGGEPKLADAGLVAPFDDARSLVGTTGYIAPEGPGAPAADIYSLGKVLYETAFGKDRHDFPQLDPNIASRADHRALLELNEIIVKACAPESRHRYQSAEAVSADLQRLCAGKSIKWRRAFASFAAVMMRAGLVLIAIAFVWGVFTLRSRQTSPRPVEWSKNEEANAAFRQGIWTFHQNASNSFAESAAYFEAAVALDPNFSRANARLARSYIWQNPGDREGLRKARHYAERALALDPNSDEANTAMAAVETLLDFDWKAAEKHHRIALRANPSGPQAEDNLYAYATFLCIVGRTNEAVKLAEKALAMDSRSLVWMQSAAFIFLCAREYDRAINILEEISRQQPSNREKLARNFLLPAYQNRGDFQAAIGLEKQFAPARARILEDGFRDGGPAGYWRRLFELDKELPDDVWVAALHARVGLINAALTYLEQSFETQPTNLALNLYREPAFDALRAERRYQDLRRKLRLP